MRSSGASVPTASELRRLAVAASIRKHGSHDQSTHGNWADRIGRIPGGYTFEEAFDPKGVQGDEYVVYHGTRKGDEVRASGELRTSPTMGYSARWFTVTTSRSAAEQYSTGGEVIELRIPMDELVDSLWAGAEDPFDRSAKQHALRRPVPIRKHADHDQSSHGNWADQLDAAARTLAVNVSSSLSGTDSAGRPIFHLSKIEVPEALRGAGRASAFMEELATVADQNGWTIALSPSSDFGASESKLRAWYKRLGFVDNKGRNADYAISESMYREPVVAKHYGSGPHPSGSEQSVHGQRTTGTTGAPSESLFRFVRLDPPTNAPGETLSRRASVQLGGEADELPGHPANGLEYYFDLGDHRRKVVAQIEDLPRMTDTKPIHPIADPAWRSDPERWIAEGGAHTANQTGLRRALFELENPGDKPGTYPVDPVRSPEAVALRQQAMADYNAARLAYDEKQAMVNRERKRIADNNGVLQMEIDAIDRRMSLAAKQLLPVVRRRGADLAAKIDDELARRLAAVAPPDPGDKKRLNPQFMGSYTSDEISAIMDKARSQSPELAKIVAEFEGIEPKLDEMRAVADDIFQSQRRFGQNARVDDPKTQEVVVEVPKSALKLAPESELFNDNSPTDREWREVRIAAEAEFKTPQDAVGYHSVVVQNKFGDGWNRVYIPFDASDDFVYIQGVRYQEMLTNARKKAARAASRLEKKQYALWQEVYAKSVLASRETYRPAIVKEILEDEGIKLGGDIVLESKRSKGAKVADMWSGYIPSAWIEASNEATPLNVQIGRARAHYLHDPAIQGTLDAMTEAKFKYSDLGVKSPALIRISGNFTNDDFLHEFGHRIEHTVPEVLFLERQFYLERTGGAQTRRVKMDGYSRNEPSRPDEFGNAYMGKRYGESLTDPSDPPYGWQTSDAHGHYWTSEAYEVLSMGLPRVMGLMPGDKLDDDSRHFTLGLIALAEEMAP